MESVARPQFITRQHSNQSVYAPAWLYGKTQTKMGNANMYTRDMADRHIRSMWPRYIYAFDLTYSASSLYILMFPAARSRSLHTEICRRIQTTCRSLYTSVVFVHVCQKHCCRSSNIGFCFAQLAQNNVQNLNHVWKTRPQHLTYWQRTVSSMFSSCKNRS